MRRRIFRSLVLMALLTALVLLTIIIPRLATSFEEQAYSALSTTLKRISQSPLISRKPQSRHIRPAFIFNGSLVFCAA